MRTHIRAYQAHAYLLHATEYLHVFILLHVGTRTPIHTNTCGLFSTTIRLKGVGERGHDGLVDDAKPRRTNKMDPTSAQQAGAETIRDSLRRGRRINTSPP